jgi:hypothetical protein
LKAMISTKGVIVLSSTSPRYLGIKV